MGDPIRIEGLRQLTRGLKAIDANAPKQLRLALNEASNIIIDIALPKVPRVTGAAAATLKAKSTRTAVRVSGGSSSAPYYPWLDFGGAVGKHKSVKRPFISDGRYLYAAYYSARDSGQLVDILEEAITRVATDAGLQVD